MNKRVIFILLLLICICTVSHVSAVDDNSTDAEIMGEANEIELTLNEGNQVINTNDYRNIQDDINQAEEGATINISGEYVCDYLININKSITINGINDTTISYNGSGEYQTPFFCVNASGVTLNNIKFVGGTFLFGGAITWLGDNGTISNCEFSDNLARGNNAIGGAILIIGDNFTIKNCTFKDNHADLYGGAILLNATGGTISNCVFEDNSANGVNISFGGAVVIRGDKNTIINCNFTNNYCSDYGGAVYITRNKNKIINCDFRHNYVVLTRDFDYELPQGGGAIYSECDNLTIDNATFVENYATGAYGGAISLNSNDTVKNSFFNANSAYMGNDIFFGTNIISNYFILDYNETIKQAVAVNMDESDLIKLNNTFNKTKLNSSVTFSPVNQGMVFTYGGSDSIVVVVEGGSVALENITVLNHGEAKITFSSNLLTVSNLAAGQYTLRVTTTPDENHTSVSRELAITVTQATASITASKITVALKKSTLWSMTFFDSSKKPISNMKVTLKIYTGSKYSTVYLTTNSKGVVSYQTKGLAKGTHKVVVTATHNNYKFQTYTSSITVVKQTALKITAKKKTFKRGASLSITVKNKKTKKAVNGVKIKLLIYTGKTYKTITLKTKKKGKYKGVCGYATNKLSVGKHKVKIVPVNIKYSGSKTSSMKITKKAKKVPAWQTKDSG